MGEQPEIEPLDCSAEDYFNVKGYSSVKDLARDQKQAKALFELVDGGMKLPALTRAVQAYPALDQFVVGEFERYRNPRTRQFGENMFSIIGEPGKYRVGHTERYCGSTIRMSVAVFSAQSGGPIVAIAHTHPYFRGVLDSRKRSRDGADFGPGDWTPMLAFQAPVYLYTPNRQSRVMEYDGEFVTVRKVGGSVRKWRVSRR